MGDTPKTEKNQNSNDDELIGTLFDEKYRITGKLGGGGMGLVYEAQHEWMERRVALKVLRPNFIDAADYEIFLERFKREAQTASRITHPNAVTIYDFGIFQQMPYLAMQFIEGHTVNEIVKSAGPMAVEHATGLLFQVLDAVEAAHALQIIHRDIKPENIMISTSANGAETAHVLDFGIAKVLDEAAESNASMTLPGKTVGTPRYMSPEQVLAKPIDVRTDIYALGLVLYEMLSGDIPFKADSSMQLMFHHVNTTPLPLREVCALADTPKRVEQVVMKALEKDPEKRFQNVGEMKEALDLALNPPASKTSLALQHLGESIARPSGIIPAEKKPAVLFLGTSAAAALVVLLTLYSLTASDPSSDSPVDASEDSSPEQTANEAKDTMVVAALEQASSPKPQDREEQNTRPSQPLPPSRPLPSEPLAAATSTQTTTQQSESTAPIAPTPTEEPAPEAASQSTESPSPSETPKIAAEDAAGTTNDKNDEQDTTEQPTTTKGSAPADSSVDSQRDEAAATTAAKESEKENTSPEATQARSKDPASAAKTTEDATSNANVSESEHSAAKQTTAPSTTPQAPTQASSKVTQETNDPAPATEEKEVTEKVEEVESGTQQEQASIASLIAALDAEDRKAREQAAIALQNRGREPIAALIDTLDNNPSPRARFWAVFILGKLRAVEATDSIVRALNDDSGMVSETAKKALRAANPAKAEELLGTSSNPRGNQGQKDSGFLGLF